MLRPAPALSPEIAALLSRAMFPDPARIARALAAYRTEPDRAVFVWEVGGVAVSAAGVRVAGAEAEVLHIGTRPDGTGQGHGRALLWAIAAHLKLSRLVAETDDAAVDFTAAAASRSVTPRTGESGAGFFAPLRWSADAESGPGGPQIGMGNQQPGLWGRHPAQEPARARLQAVFQRVQQIGMIGGMPP